MKVSFPSICRHLLLSCLISLAGIWLAGCSEDDAGTGLRIITSFHQGLGIDQLFVKVTPQGGETKQNQTPKGDDPLKSPYALLVLVPDSWDSKQVTVKISGLKAGAVQAGASASTTIEAGRVVELTMQLIPDCQETCTPGTKECVADQHRTCRVDQLGCAGWSVPEDCPQDEPYCSEGQCSDQCHDECAAKDQRRCTADGRSVQICGQHDSDTCLDWGPTLSCQQQELCLDGQCIPDCGGAPCECQAGQTQACEDIGQCSGGVRQCVDGQFGPCLWQVGPTAEQCDGKDNDCNGMADDGMVAPPCSKQQGVCEGALGTCAGTEGWQNCTDQDYAQVAATHGNTYETEETLCDGTDNDCDGKRDEAAGCCPSDCTGKACGEDDGCGNPCQSGSCSAPSEICISGKCVCQPDCAGKVCGADNGCGDPCQTGTCGGSNEVCQAGTCVCQPSCAGKLCGADDGCGNPCQTGTCGTNQSCNNGVCQCSFESCYGTCCDDGQVCADGSCCTPDCADKVCGTESVCGSSCGNCAVGGKCTDQGTCKMGPEWEQVTSPANQYTYFQAVHGTSASDVWAVAKGGIILHYDGTDWTEDTSPVQHDLYDVFALSATTAWAVGATGTLLAYDGAWTKVELTTTSGNPFYGPLSAIWASSSSNVWAGGATSSSYGGRLLYRYNGSSWSQVTALPAMFFYGICGTSSSNIWFVGRSDVVNVRKVARYNGSSFVGPDLAVSDQSCSSSSSCHLSACWMASSSNVWAVGSYGGIFHYDGTEWTKVYSGLGSYVDIEGIWGSSASDIWAVYDDGNTQQGLLHYDGTSWKKVAAPAGQYFMDIWGSSSQDIWAVGYPNTLLHYFF